MVEQRAEEINKIAQSISELAVIFKELNMLVVEQGTIVDRIDYNCEQSSLKMEKAIKHLARANEYQKRSRMTLCIMLLLILIGKEGMCIVVM